MVSKELPFKEAQSIGDFFLSFGDLSIPPSQFSLGVENAAIVFFSF